jgi:prepilin-type N-terminal cleavage/methylation domain-containing protein
MCKQQSDVKPSIWKTNRGFTLIEVMIGMVIFAIGILSVAAMQTSATRGNTTANRTTRAFTWCSDRMEFLKSLPFTDARLVAGNYPQVAPTTENDGVDNDYDGLIDEAGETGVNLTWNITDVGNTKLITVTANWRTPLGRQKTHTLRTVIAQNAIAN